MYGIYFAKLKKVTQPWHECLKGKELFVGEIDGSYNLLAVSGDRNWVENLCKYVYKNDKKMYEELGYESLESYIENCMLGNDGFGFDKDEIEIIEEVKE